jgi:hypothetical protein
MTACVLSGALCCALVASGVTNWGCVHKVVMLRIMARQRLHKIDEKPADDEGEYSHLHNFVDAHLLKKINYRGSLTFMESHHEIEQSTSRHRFGVRRSL